MTDASVFVGQSWESPEGVRTVVEERGGRFLVSTAGGLPQIMSESDVRFDMRRDAANLASRQRGAAQRESERTEQSEREDTQGFLESRTPMQATKALVALMTQMRFSGEFLTRKAFIERAVREGYTVEGTNLVSPSGSYYEQKAISKTALDYARHLIGLRRNPIDLERVPGVIVKEIPDALARAVRVGAAPDADYVGAGMTSIVFLSRGRAWKVARPGPADLRAEAEYLAAANKLRLPEGRAAKVYAYHEGQRVIEREYVEGRYAPDERAWDLRQALAKRLSKDWGPPEFKKDSYVLTPEDEIVLVDAGTSRRGENLAAYILKVMDGTYKDTPDRSWAWELRQDVSDGRLSRERAEEVFSEMARHWDLKSVVAEQRALFKENPHHPDVLEILERKFPLDWGFWGFDVKKHIEKDAFGYLAPIGVEVKALPGEEVVTIRHHRKDPMAARYGEGSDEDFTGAKAIFTPEPIPAAQVIEFGLYPDYYALPHFLIEILNGADHVELQNARGDLALIHRDTYPSEMREHRGKVADYRVTYFDEHGPSGHHNGDFYGLILEALGGGYRRLAPGALDRLGL